MYKYLISVGLGLALIGCGGGGSSSDNTSSSSISSEASSSSISSEASSSSISSEASSSSISSEASSSSVSSEASSSSEPSIVGSQKYKTVYDIEGAEMSLIYQYSYNGAKYNYISFTLDSMNTSKGFPMLLTSISAGYPTAVCMDRVNGSVKDTVFPDGTIKWDFECLIIENEYTSYSTAIVFIIEEDGTVKGVFNKDISSSNALLNVYNNYDGIVFGTADNLIKAPLFRTKKQANSIESDQIIDTFISEFEQMK